MCAIFKSKNIKSKNNIIIYINKVNNGSLEAPKCLENKVSVVILRIYHKIGINECEALY